MAAGIEQRRSLSEAKAEADAWGGRANEASEDLFLPFDHALITKINNH